MFTVHGQGEGLSCDICNKRFERAERKDDHMNIVHNISKNEYLCGECGQNFFNKENFKRHEKSHRENTRCDICDKTFKSSKNLNDHLKNQHKSRPVECQLQGCNKSFMKKTNLKRHMNTHSEVDQTVDMILTSIINEVTRNQLNPIVHMVRHQYFDCDKCEKTYAQKHSLKYHQKTKHN